MTKSDYHQNKTRSFFPVALLLQLFYSQNYIFGEFTLHCPSAFKIKMFPYDNRKVRQSGQKAPVTIVRNSKEHRNVQLLALKSGLSRPAIAGEYCLAAKDINKGTERKESNLTKLISGKKQIGHKILCKYQQIRANSSSPTWPSIHIFTVHLTLLISLISLESQCLVETKGEQGRPSARTGPHLNRPESSSSMFADVEDMNDSSVRTRFGTIQIEHLGNSPQDFDNLIERIVPGELQSYKIGAAHRHSSAQQFDESVGVVQHILPPQLQQIMTSKVHADANNRTTMRFFRNSKTFASIVYTNPVQDHQVKPRRLINCHLVDLEKHASDVAIYEAKYEIKTIDVEFKEMMQLIEACTNIARLRRRPVNGIGQQPGAPGSQYKTSSYQQATTEAGTPGVSSSHHPTVVVGRPLGMGIYFQHQTAPQMPQSQNRQQSSNANQMQSVGPMLQRGMNGPLNSGFQQAKPINQVADELELYPQTIVFTEQHNHIDGVNIVKNNNTKPDHYHQKRKRNQVSDKDDSGGGRTKKNEHDMRHRFDPYPTPKMYVNYTKSRAKTLKRQLQSNPVVKTLAKVRETGKKLVLGEVTAPSIGVINRNGSSKETNGGSSLREALQEISSYDSSDLLSIWRGILPGTNWCGMGDRATSYNDLGFESDIDICCRSHDFCPVRLSAFTSGYGLFNWSFYTRSHCWCDQNFLDCLQQAESPLSTVVMKFYFGIMKTTCLNEIETSSANGNQKQHQQQHLGGQQRNNNQFNKYVGGGQSPAFSMSNLSAAPALKQSRWLQTKYERPKQ